MPIVPHIPQHVSMIDELNLPDPSFAASGPDLQETIVSPRLHRSRVPERGHGVVAANVLTFGLAERLVADRHAGR